MRYGKKTTQNGAPFVSFYDMRAVTFVLPEEMEEVLMAALPWFILIRLNHMGSHRPNDSRSKPYLHREKKIEYLDQDSTKPSAILRIKRKAVVRLLY